MDSNSKDRYWDLFGNDAKVDAYEMVLRTLNNLYKVVDKNREKLRKKLRMPLTDKDDMIKVDVGIEELKKNKDAYSAFFIYNETLGVTATVIDALTKLKKEAGEKIDDKKT